MILKKSIISISGKIQMEQRTGPVGDVYRRTSDVFELYAQELVQAPMPKP
jgi:hypothetical protein